MWNIKMNLRKPYTEIKKLPGILGSGGSGNKPELKNGELPDVDPNAVDVRQPAMIGKNGKRLWRLLQQR